jgi:SPP1 gp7 family putative phage head morphogenesis protein
MATARVGRIGRAPARVSARIPRAGRVPPAARGTARLEARRTGPIIDTSKLSRVARRRIASPPMAAVDRVGEAVHAAVLRWAEAFIARVVRDIVPGIVRQDATEDDIDAILNALDDPELSKSLLEKAFKSVDAASSDDLRVIGVQTSTVVSNAEVLQAEWLRQSTDLIRATEDVRRRVERILKDPVSEGRSVADIRGMLVEQAGYAASRAELTARTVTLQTYGKIQEQRQRDAGFTQYVWTTSLDERVREDHALLDGTVQSWDDPPIIDSRTGRRGHPGSDFQCRCSAVPYVDPNEAEDIEAVEAPAPAPAVEAPVELPASRAPLSTSELVERAEIDVSRGGKAKAADQVAQAVESALPGRSLDDLKAIPFTVEDLATDKSLEFLRKDPFFAATGNVADNFGSSRSGLPQITIDASGEAYLSNGRHRVTVARELGLRQIVARVRRVGPRGGVLWEYVGPIRV